MIFSVNTKANKGKPLVLCWCADGVTWLLQQLRSWCILQLRAHTISCSCYGRFPVFSDETLGSIFAFTVASGQYFHMPTLCKSHNELLCEEQSLWTFSQPTASCRSWRRLHILDCSFPVLFLLMVGRSERRGKLRSGTHIGDFEGLGFWGLVGKKSSWISSIPHNWLGRKQRTNLSPVFRLLLIHLPLAAIMADSMVYSMRINFYTVLPSPVRCSLYAYDQYLFVWTFRPLGVWWFMNIH